MVSCSESDSGGDIMEIKRAKRGVVAFWIVVAVLACGVIWADFRFWRIVHPEAPSWAWIMD